MIASRRLTDRPTAGQVETLLGALLALIIVCVFCQSTCLKKVIYVTAVFLGKRAAEACNACLFYTHQLTSPIRKLCSRRRKPDDEETPTETETIAEPNQPANQEQAANQEIPLVNPPLVNPNISTSNNDDDDEETDEQNGEIVQDGNGGLVQDGTIADNSEESKTKPVI